MPQRGSGVQVEAGCLAEQGDRAVLAGRHSRPVPCSGGAEQTAADERADWHFHWVRLWGWGRGSSRMGLLPRVPVLGGRSEWSAEMVPGGTTSVDGGKMTDRRGARSPTEVRRMVLRKGTPMEVGNSN